MILFIFFLGKQHLTAGSVALCCEKRQRHRLTWQVTRKDRSCFCVSALHVTFVVLLHHGRNQTALPRCVHLSSVHGHRISWFKLWQGAGIKNRMEWNRTGNPLCNILPQFFPCISPQSRRRHIRWLDCWTSTSCTFQTRRDPRRTTWWRRRRLAYCLESQVQHHCRRSYSSSSLKQTNVTNVVITGRNNHNSKCFSAVQRYEELKKSDFSATFCLS